MNPHDIDSLRIATPADVRPAAEAFYALARDRFDCRVATCHNIAVKQLMRDAEGNILATDVFGWTDDEDDRWWRTPQLALASPLTTACRYESDPFWCNGDGFYTMRPNRWLDGIDLTNFERRSFARTAIVVPIHMPFGQIGAVSFTSTDPSRTDLSEEFAAHGETLGLYSRAFITSYQRVMVAPERLPVGGTMLSKREVECLRWAAIGKTDYEISLIMARSRATVRFHIHNAATKLDAVNRSQTVFKAAQLGYIGLNS
ncbi:helix-turn-helix transcriptional regulator [Rhizorhabdus dicambivorans]|nr:LuxR C-terminal-related transcriptional regulator [Rhizorhabdus dicambivorans]